MSKARIIAQGTHDELLKSNPLYTKLYEMQFLDEQSSNILNQPSEI